VRLLGPEPALLGKSRPAAGGEQSPGMWPEGGGVRAFQGGVPSAWGGGRARRPAGGGARGRGWGLGSWRDVRFVPAGPGEAGRA
jgi:hypothetical protein